MSELFSYIDHALAQELFEAASPAAHSALAYLSAARRAGHLCIRVQEGGLHPAPGSLLSQEGEEPDLASLEEELLEGLRSLPEDVVGKDASATPVVHWGNLYYFQKAWAQETSFLAHLERLLQGAPSLQIAREAVESAVRGLEDAKRLLPEQADAIRKVSQGSLTLICGGPGTGKTYTAGQCLRLLSDALAEEGRPLHVLLAAPTGKAAANLQASLQKAMGGQGLAMTAQTLHGLLGIGRRQKRVGPLMADLILVDECSMVDAGLMAELFASVPSGARLVLLGDRYQLPPVESGSFFSALASGQSLSDCTVTLKTCVRAELKGLVDVAERVKVGDSTFIEDLCSGAFQGIGWRDFAAFESERSFFNRALADAAQPLFLSGPIGDPKQILQDLARFRLLCPLRKGPFGVESINRLLGQVHRDHVRGLAIAPIMICKNDYRLGLFNGEVGALVRHPGDGMRDYALFPGEGDEIRRLPALQLPQYELAYCMSVHKSQGSEFNKVLLLLPPGSEWFGREVLYTGITRSKQSLEIWASRSVLGDTVALESERLSGCVDRMIYRNSTTSL
ncbi:MAG: exodeoxyribonuclease V subunit alpha [Chlamydiia bacterium]|nr:exodeoxyribonuclease V subunit alpha [Chlamydiia bacterium]